MKRFLAILFWGVILSVVGAFAYNFSWLDDPHREGPAQLIAHRGVHQTFDLEGVANDTCTATRIHAPTHNYIENTIPSMQAAFDAGAAIVELDVHLTPDGEFAVFHDWTLDCRTDGQGVTEDTPMPTLRTLDVGYGYTADNGATYPLRGKGMGMMPTLGEVFAANPDREFLVNFKSNRADEGQALVDLIAAHPEWRGQLWGVYGGEAPTNTTLNAVPDLTGYTRDSLMTCAKDYMLLGWTGIVPDACRNTTVAVPANYAWMVWGWPHKFTRRMEAANTNVILLGAMENGDIGSSGIDSVTDLKQVPEGFGGYVWTNRIELLGPALAAGQQPEPAPPPAPPEPVEVEEPAAELASASAEDAETEDQPEGHYIGDPDGC